MIQTEAADKEHPLTETFIRQLHHTLLREDYTMYRQSPDGATTSYVIHAGVYKTRPNSVITVTGERFEYASPEETPALMSDLVKWYNDEEQKPRCLPSNWLPSSTIAIFASTPLRMVMDVLPVCW